MSSIPGWIVILQALLTPAIAIAVGVIGFLQWRTAHQKVVLDLFDRRMKVVNGVRDFQGLVFRGGVKQELADVARFHQVRHEAEFLFGSDVVNYLKGLHDTVIEMSTATAALDTLDDPQTRSEYVKASLAKLKKVVAMSSEFTALCAPYMRMDQKRVRTPTEWLQYRNDLRNSYADKP
ncbi:hypothetical protein P6U16_01245 [Rhizobium sp. 32-5/1]|uniref:hypothetical protein n=1 Tax=Rhizobium sp. 32-5/1 TaxID=3019602 RepID=UPI00240D399B|nr:hypothetical protein [Rhizobium sp. 32-5/1]WEZ83511.1 hypothetical protein P6U16_01245 [Rhizobium sp. 32-5/1]